MRKFVIYFGPPSCAGKILIIDAPARHRHQDFRGRERSGIDGHAITVGHVDHVGHHGRIDDHAAAMQDDFAGGGRVEHSSGRDPKPALERRGDGLDGLQCPGVVMVTSITRAPPSYIAWA